MNSDTTLTRFTTMATLASWLIQMINRIGYRRSRNVNCELTVSHPSSAPSCCLSWGNDGSHLEDGILHKYEFST